MGSIFNFDVPAWNLIIRATVVYFGVLLLLRISGKRVIGQMGATEFVAILLISNAVQNSMNGGSNSLTGGILLAAVLIAFSTGISYLTYKSKKIEAVIEGVPTILIHKGRVVRENLAHERLRERDLKILLRKQGVHNIEEVEIAILEADGTFTITKKSDTPPSYIDSIT